MLKNIESKKKIFDNSNNKFFEKKTLLEQKKIKLILFVLLDL